MFLSESHLPQVLPAAAYTSDAALQAERENIFLPGWHFIGWEDELSKEGDFLTETLFDFPVIVWRKSGQYRGFLNVCAHRFSKLTDLSCGNSERLTCQYHGWQYNAAGDTQRIPDAQSFKPLEPGKLGLRSIPVQQFGKLLFVQLPTESPGREFEDQFGSASELFQSAFTARHKLLYSASVNVAANWKLIVENAVESYHVSFVHKQSFGEMPDAETCSHNLQPNFTHFQTTAPSHAPWFLRALDKCVDRLLGAESTERYEHLHVYPNLLVSTTKYITILMSVQPVTPSESRFDMHVLGDPGPYRNPLSRLAFWCASQFAIRQTRRVLQEDFEILPSIQAGINSPVRPGQGLISIREERVHHFQQSILNLGKSS